LKLTTRLRLCATLPTLFAKAARKHHRDVALRILQTSLAKAIRQSSERQQPLLDFAVACFVHFLSRVPAFVEEANMVLTAFIESSRISAFFVEALLRTDPSKSADLATTVLKVTERVHHFVDREAPNSDKIHKAAYVLKHVMEKRCPELGKLDVTLKGGGLPAELFSVPPPQTFTEPSQIADAKKELPPRENRILSLEKHGRKDCASGSRPALTKRQGQQSLFAAKTSASLGASIPAIPYEQKSMSAKPIAPLRTSSPAIPHDQQSLSAKFASLRSSSPVLPRGQQSLSAKPSAHVRSSSSAPPRTDPGSSVSVAPQSSDLPGTRLLTSPVIAEEDEAPYSEIRPRCLSYPTSGGKGDLVSSASRGSARRLCKRDSLDSQIERMVETKRSRTTDNPPSPGLFQ